MQKYRTTEYLDLLIDGEAHAVEDGFDHDQPVYLASEVDARIAVMEMGLRAIIGEVNGCGPKCSDEFKRIALDSIRGIATRAL